MILTNPAFIILSILGCFLLWVFMSCFFTKIGEKIHNIINNIFKNNEEVIEKRRKIKK